MLTATHAAAQSAAWIWKCEENIKGREQHLDTKDI